ncbi:hypothetical protein PN465_22925 [Nodularia spumigena CS-584]|jgi:hypothetical protein|uniref:Uncharacterized protein n=2 Tax=Nodularia spumigena TaxID=70799 RepID=A0A161UX17_NODSP|nr:MULTISPECIES: hypothetical protein [Cyanophyceae]MDB9356085.1 hypothetical protein [Nodularia spumigena CS-587/03]AHJ27009.1 hypothetical protein NSP_6610 [Nodularia spumigena CCY9414]EAW44504.1 hypothetical protein N9414_16379 [Nodularia spumigena CCY9414]KZL50673.1 hypothetical protein A2T98_06390 [Nodularia spumigena CENA596]MDB9303419.1 hypothetical protein [Nodularia spumigena CS-591/12]
MSQAGLNLFIPMELLINSLSALNLSEKKLLWEILDQAIAEAEEESWEEDEATAREIQLVRDEYANGEYTTFEQYLSNQRK